MSIHDGHRQRMRQRVERESLENFEPHEVLEVLLYYCIPREDTNPIAHALIKRYKTVARVLEATPKELQSVDGIGAGAAFFLSMLNQANRYINVERATEQSNTVMASIRDYSEYLKNLFDGMTNEAVYILCLDAKRMPIGHYKISEGNATSTTISARKITEVVLSSNATSVILAHNHPGGLLIPSEEDRFVTEQLRTLLEGIGVILIDHIIVSGKDYLSIMQTACNGMYKRYLR